MFPFKIYTNHLKANHYVLLFTIVHLRDYLVHVFCLINRPRNRTQPRVYLAKQMSDVVSSKYKSSCFPYIAHLAFSFIIYKLDLICYK